MLRQAGVPCHAYPRVRVHQPRLLVHLFFPLSNSQWRSRCCWNPAKIHTRKKKKKTGRGGNIPVGALIFALRTRFFFPRRGFFSGARRTEKGYRRVKAEKRALLRCSALLCGYVSLRWSELNVKSDLNRCCLHWSRVCVKKKETAGFYYYCELGHVLL